MVSTHIIAGEYWGSPQVISVSDTDRGGIKFSTVSDNHRDSRWRFPRSTSARRWGKGRDISGIFRLSSTWRLPPLCSGAPCLGRAQWAGLVQSQEKASSILLKLFPPNPEITGLAEIPAVDFKSSYCLLNQHEIKSLCRPVSFWDRD